MSTLVDAIVAVEKLLGEMDALVGGVPPATENYGAWRKAHNQSSELVRERMAELGGSVSIRSGQVFVRLAGIGSSSTIGTRSALGNWIINARSKVGTSGDGA